MDVEYVLEFSSNTNFGEELRRLRLDRGLTLREFCKRSEYSHGAINPRHVSRWERRIEKPPCAVSNSFEDMVRILELTETERAILVELSSYGLKADPLPPLTDEELAPLLPLFLHTKLTEEQLDIFIEDIRMEYSPIY